MLQGLRNSKFSKALGYLLLLNFINLSANFYQAASPYPQDPSFHDPIDNMTELVLEYMLDMDGDTVPDTEIPHEKIKLKDFKPFLVIRDIFIPPVFLRGEKPDSIYIHGFFQDWEKQTLAPPPKTC